MNTQVLNFFRQHYAPGRICLIGSSDPVYKLIREAQSGITPDKKPSKFNHVFIMGPCRDDGRGDGGIYIFESDLHVSVKDWEVKNGLMESRIVKWCRDDLDYAGVLGLPLSQQEQEVMLRKALELAYDENHYRYPVGELFGTLWAILTKALSKKNIFDMKHAIQCATFVRLCYQNIGKEILTTPTHPSNTSPEEIWQSGVFVFRQEWKKI
ncbi:MAG: hypothetical protein V1799_01535 [bacterium]